MSSAAKPTPELRETIAQLIRAGNAPELAARASGIDGDTLSAWIERGAGARKADAPYRDFRAAVEQAQAEAEAILVTQISRAASKGSWGAAAWLLERIRPVHWGKPDSARDDDASESKDRLDELAQRRATRRRGAES